MGIYVSIHISQGWQFVFCSLSYSLPASGASLPKFLARGQSNVLAKAIGSIIPLNLPDMGGIPTIKIWVYLFALPTLRLFFGGRLDLDFSAIINDLDINVHETRFNHEDLSLLGVMCVFASRKLALNMWKLDTDMRAISTGTECIYTKGRQLYSWRYWRSFPTFLGAGDANFLNHVLHDDDILDWYAGGVGRWIQEAYWLVSSNDSLLYILGWWWSHITKQTRYAMTLRVQSQWSNGCQLGYHWAIGPQKTITVCNALQ